ncbi:LOW QUALITY PROTEIN: uncharacterized protein LOC135222835 [Macrobrachium nipponense]|uniref:LOW QUALITY PROTEIN: uncharacterized protein LOC135222835 n=1 Tax=Macrobrachium nipponense TaxID=159736 RepID=UPI0030C8D1DB
MKLKRLVSSLALLIVLSLPITFAEDWSWGTVEDVSTFPPSENSTSGFDTFESNNSSEVEPSDREPRFLGFSEKLCSLGIGSKCDKKPYPDAVDSHYGPPPVVGSSLTSSSYATLEYDNYSKEGHGYPSVPSKVSAGGIKPFFVPPKPYPQTIVKPHPTHHNTHQISPTYEAPKPTYKVPEPAYEAPKPAYEAPNPSHITVPHGDVKPSSVVQHIHSHTHIHHGAQENAPSGSAVFVSTGSALPSSGKTIVQSPVGDKVSGSGFHSTGQSEILQSSSVGAFSSATFGGQVIGNFGDQVSSTGFQSSGQSGSAFQPSSKGVSSAVSSGTIPPFQGQVGSAFGDQISSTGFHSSGVFGSGSIPSKVIPPVSTGDIQQSSFGGHVSGTGFQSSGQSSSVFQTISNGVASAVSGVTIPPYKGQVGGAFGDQTSINGFHSSGVFGSVTIPSKVFLLCLLEISSKLLFGGHVSGTGFQSSGQSVSNFQTISNGVASSVSGGNIPPFKGQVGSTFGDQISSTGFHSSGVFGSGTIPSKVIPSVSTGVIQQSSFGGQVTGSEFQSTVNVGSGVQTVQTRPFLGPIIEANTPGYQEECRCVAKHLCPIADVIPRHSSIDIRELIDARSRVSDILSNATDLEETEITTTIAPEIDTVIPDNEEESRQKRDILTADIHGHDDVDYQERQFSGYVPGLTGCESHQVCCRNPVYAPRKKHHTCGKSNAAGLLGRVKNPSFVNDDSEFAEYPWQAAILKLDQGENVYVCGAVLITDRHLLTAAHCVKSLHSNTMIIRMGDWDVTTAAEFYQHVEIPVSEVVIHPEYYAGNLQNDIALMTLQYPVDFDKNPHISPVCLPEKYDSFIGQRCHSTGWGKDAHGDGGKFQRVLKEVEVPVLSHLQCQKALRFTRLGASFSLPEGNICAGGEEGRDTCEGDGGGPLVCPGHNGYAQLVGLVSWGIGCGKVGIPGVYVDVAHYLDWIRANSH